MAATFASIAMLAKVGGGWAVEANQYGRHVAIVLGPLAALGGRLSESNDHSHDAGDVWPSLLLGVATGLLWAPCAGPVLILIGAALEGATVQTTLPAARPFTVETSTGLQRSLDPAIAKQHLRLYTHGDSCRRSDKGFAPQ